MKPNFPPQDSSQCIKLFKFTKPHLERLLGQKYESESGQVVLEKVKWAYSYVYLSQIMWKHAKNSMKVLKRPTSSFLQGDIDDVLELFAKNDENKAN